MGFPGGSDGKESRNTQFSESKKWPAEMKEDIINHVDFIL